MVTSNDGKLINDQPIILAWLVAPVYQSGFVMLNPAIADAVLDVHALDQQAMKVVLILEQAG